MSQTSSKPTVNTSSKRGSRGFFAVLAMCLIAVGGVAASTFSQTLRPVEVPTLPSSPTTGSAAPTTTVTSAAPVAVTPATTAKTTTRTTTTTASTDNTSALFVLPLSNQILTPYSETPLYSETLCEYRVHKAVDFEGEALQKVRACASGTVSDVNVDAVWGASITLDHGSGITTVYRGVDATVVKGATVNVGDTIGNLAAIPCESAMKPHLHIEMYQNGKAMDFTTVVSGQLSPVK